MHKIFIIILLLSYSFTNAQIVINEYSASNMNTTQDNFNENDDWFELYNTGTSDVDISGWYLSDKTSKPLKFMIPGGVVPAGGYLMVICSGRAEYSGGFLHTSFKLTQTKPEAIVFSDAGGILVDQVQMVPAQENHSRGRTSDGNSTWSVFDSPTPGTANSNPKTSYASTPQFSIPSGSQGGNISLDITSTDANITIYYTLDGTVPTQSSTAVSGSIPISTTTVVKAISFSSDGDILPSFIETNTYFINVSHTMKIISMSGDKVDDLITDTDPNAFFDNFMGAIELFNSAGTLLDEGLGNYNHHGNDSWAYDQRGVDFIMKDQFGYNYALQDPLFKGKTRDSYQRIMIKAAANDNVSFEPGGAYIRDAYVQSLSQIGDLKLDERSYEPAVLYVNGEFWGLYEIREKVADSDFTDYYYDQDENYGGSADNIQYLRTWGGTIEMYGAPNAQSDWDALVNYITTNDMADQANFDYVDSLLNWKSLIDYFCVNSYVVCADWLDWNTSWWRGLDPDGDKKKWRYTLWDMDASFGHYINYTGIPDQSANADPCAPESLPDPGGQGHTEILSALMNNSEFYQYYVSRYIDLGNSVFSCDYMHNHLDSLITLIEPEMPAQVAKWGSDLTTWNNNVQALRDFITTRCTTIQSGMVDCYDLTGPYDLTFNVDPPNSGTIKVNSIWLEQFPFTGTYYGNIDIMMKAKAANGFIFDHWEMTDVPNPNTDSSEVVFQATGAQDVVAFFRQEDTPPLHQVYEGVYIPTAFSPNGDGENDKLEIFFGDDVSSYWIQVYDRWGQMVFQSQSIDNFWDGSFKGVDLNSSVFVYELRTYFIDGNQKTDKGNITLVR